MSYMSNAEFPPAIGIQELSVDEIDYVAGGPGPAVAGAAGAVAGAGVALVSELTDDKPGVNVGNVVIGAAAGAGAAVTATLGVAAGIAGAIGFGSLANQSTKVNTAMSN